MVAVASVGAIKPPENVAGTRRALRTLLGESESSSNLRDPQVQAMTSCSSAIPIGWVLRVGLLYRTT